MGTTTYISATWNLKGEEELLELNEFGYGRRSYQILEDWYFDIDELYPGEQEAIGDPDDWDSLHSIRIVTVATCKKAFCTTLARVYVLRDLNPDEYHKEYEVGEKNLHEELIQKFDKELQNYPLMLDRLKKRLMEIPPNTEVLEELYYAHSALLFTYKIYQKAKAGAKDIKLHYSAS